MLRPIAIGLLAAVGGILGNLVAAILQQSLGTFTPFQLVLMIVGILLVIALTAFVSKGDRHSKANSDELIELQRKLKEERNQLYQMDKRFKSGIPPGPKDVDAWLKHQEVMDNLKEQLRENGSTAKDDPIDQAAPPSLGCLLRSTLLLRQLLSSLIVIPFVIALAISYLVSPLAQRVIIDSLPQPGPGPAETATPFAPETATVVPSPAQFLTPTLEAKASVTVAPENTDVMTETTAMTTTAGISDTGATQLSSPEPVSTRVPTRSPIPTGTPRPSATPVAITSPAPLSPIVGSQPALTSTLNSTSGCTPDFRILEPEDGAVFIRGDVVKVLGELTEPYFREYDLYKVQWARPGSSIEDSADITSGWQKIPPEETSFDRWDTISLNANIYNLRLVAMRSYSGDYMECTITVYIK